MKKLYVLALLGCAWTMACTGGGSSSDSTGPSSADWSKIGEAGSYSYYADRGSIRKADETVTMSDLFDYKTGQAEGGSTALSKMTAREYDCQNQKSQAIKVTWYAGQMGSGTVVRTIGTAGQLTAVASGTATASLIKIACGS